MEEFDPLLEVSNLTDDSKLFHVLNASPKLEPAPPTPPQHTLVADPSSNLVSPSKRTFFPRFETPKKLRRAFKQTAACTPETAPMDDDSDGLSSDSNFQHQTEKEVTVRVDDCKEITFDKLLGRLRDSKDLTGVEIYRLTRVSNKRRRTHDEMMALFAAIQNMPCLTNLILNSFSFFDLEIIGPLVRNLKTLEKLHVHLVSGTVDIRFLDCLAEAPALKEISLDVQNSFPLHHLLCSKVLTRVVVPSERFKFDERHLVFAMNALEKNETLRILDLKPKLSSSDVRLISFGIRRNKALKILRFSYLVDEEGAAKVALLHFTNALAQNTCLEGVENHYRDLLRLRPMDAYRMLKLVEGHSTLKDFALFNREQVDQDMLEDMSQHKDNPPTDSFFSRIFCSSALPSPFVRLFPDDVSRFFQGTGDNDKDEGHLREFSNSISRLHDQLQESLAHLWSLRSSEQPQQQPQ